MKNISLKCVLACLTAMAACLTTKAPAAEATEASNVYTPTLNTSMRDSTAAVPLAVNANQATSATVKKKSSFLRHFTWGVDLGASVDLSGEDLSTFDAETYFGYKGSWIRTAAVGAGIHKAFGNQYTFVPLFALVRTSFRSKPSLMFLELKAGYSFNTLYESGSFGGAYGSVGVGINLAMSKSIQSHIILSYSYFTLRKATELDIPYSGDNINSAVLRFGVNF